VREGGTNLLVPAASLERAVPPTSPVFFNPATSTSRDVSVALVQATRGSSFCDGIAGVGSRGVRVANEVSRRMEVTMVDINKESIRLAKRSAKANGVSQRCEFVNGEANSFFYSANGRKDRFDYADLDPFGTPAPYIQPLLNAVVDSGIASVTATDTAVLCGVHEQVSKRRYGAIPLNNEFHHETGIRILLNACRRQGAVLDLGIAPVMAHSTRHYIRVYFRVLVGATNADSSAAKEGYLIVCRKCGERTASSERAQQRPTCGSRAPCAGPLWVGPITEKAAVEKAGAAARKLRYVQAEKMFQSLQDVDSFPPWSFSLEKICSSLRVPTVPMEAVMKTLADAGFRSLKQPFEVRGLKTDASHKEVVMAVAQVAGNRKFHF